MRRRNHDDLPYNVESVDVVAETLELRVSVLTLCSGQEVPWHYHTNVTDSFFCLSGTVHIEEGSQSRSVRLDPGESHRVVARTPHRVTGTHGAPCRFLIVQGVGSYDFVPVKD